MSLLNPAETTAGDLCTAALAEALVVGEGQSATRDQLAKAQTRLQWMLQQWQRERQLVWYLVDMSVATNGKLFYTIGPGGDIDTNQYTNPFGNQFGSGTVGGANPFGPTTPVSARPASIQSAFLRQPNVGAANNVVLTAAPQGSLPIDYPLEIIKAREDYNKIAFKPMVSLSQWLFYESSWPLGKLFPWPVPNANIYELHVSVMAQLPPMFATSAAVVNLPFEYFNALVLNLAVRLKALYGVPSFQGDSLPGEARNALKVIRGANLQIARLGMPSGLVSRGKGYNIFSDQFGG